MCCMVYAELIYFILSNTLLPCHDRQQVPATSRYEAAYPLKSTVQGRWDKLKKTEKLGEEG